MNIFDAHVHMEKGLAGYDIHASRRNFIFNSIESYRSLRSEVPEGDCVSLVLELDDKCEFLLGEVSAKRVHAVKIHSRVQKIGAGDYAIVLRNLRLLPRELPVIYDAFYYGADFEHQPDLRAFAGLAQALPDRTFVAAHSGGYKVLKYFFHLRELSNVCFDLSFSLQYLEDSSAFADLRKLLFYTAPDRILFGSDFPYASASKQLQILLRLTHELALSPEALQWILHDTCNGIFSRMK